MADFTDYVSGKSWKRIGSGPQEKKSVKRDCVLLADILERNDAPREIDYLSLDIEGGEYEVLRVFPFDKWMFRCMTIEHNAHMGPSNQAKREEIRKLLLSNGYRLARRRFHTDDLP
jgi:hypothetical protein